MFLGGTSGQLVEAQNQVSGGQSTCVVRIDATVEGRTALEYKTPGTDFIIKTSGLRPQSLSQPRKTGQITRRPFLLDGSHSLMNLLEHTHLTCCSR